MNQEKVMRSIKAYRELHDVSQEELAKVIGIDRTYLNQIERGKKVPSLALLERITQVIGLNLKDFF